MSAVYNIKDDIFEDDFWVLALHTSIVDYLLAFRLNALLGTQFKRSRNNLEVSELASFPLFEWEDAYLGGYWALIANYSEKKVELQTNDLFQDQPTGHRQRCIPELKEVDYFLKIEDEHQWEKVALIKALQTIPQVVTSYGVDLKTIKSRNNLIF